MPNSVEELKEDHKKQEDQINDVNFKTPRPKSLEQKVNLGDRLILLNEYEQAHTRTH
jgi:hypothetical protein